jgi:branched-chain amino acid transport system substrate-binding protein
MTISRRDLLLAGASLGATAGLGTFPKRALAADPIRIGVLEDLSGAYQGEGVSKAHCAQLAVDEINAAGGLLGRPVEVVGYDAQSDNQLYAQYAQQLALKDKVAVVHACLLSSSREVVRPILHRAKVLYFYDTEYEGGVCDKNCFLPGPTPAQTLGTMLSYGIKNFGKRIYAIGADYNYGRLSVDAAVGIAKELGGEIIAQDFYPLNASDFSASINRIQAEKPDAIHSVLIGAGQSFYTQFKAAGGKVPILGQAFGNSGELLTLPHDVSNGIVVVKNYFDEIDTPANKAFRAALLGKYPKEVYISTNGIVSYSGVHLWAAAVTKANSIDRDAVIAALETGIQVDSPSGPVKIDPKTHHAYQDMYLALTKDGKYDIVETHKNVAPVLNDPRCDLIANPDTNTQFTRT